MSLRCWFALPLMAALSSSAHAEPAPLAPSDFAYGRALNLPESVEPVVQVELPLDVYRAMRGKDLRELMVFNAHGAQVPHAIRSLQRGPDGAPESVPLAFFPLTLAAAQSQRAADLALEVERNNAGQVIRIAANSDDVNNSKPPAPQPIAAYILDARELPRAMVGLRVALAEGADDRVLELRLEASDDLVSFFPVTVDGALIQLGHGGQRIDRDELSVAPTSAKFYRLKPVRVASFPGAVSSVSATLAAAEATRRFEKVVAEPSASPKPGVFRFDLGGPVPVDRVEVELPEQNTIVNAELWSSDREEGPYERAARARLYRLQRKEAELKGPTLDLARRSDRFYELRVAATGGGVGNGKPVLATYHAPDQLLFLRRGEGPFTLAYGRYESPNTRFEADDILSLLPRDAAAVASATLGERKPLGGPERLTPPPPPPPYKTYAIWAVLILGVALLGVLAVHLARTNASSR
jgi:hypothetical protein